MGSSSSFRFAFPSVPFSPREIEPIVRSSAELDRLVERMRSFRGEIEGGLCFRRVERYTCEHRLFVWQGQAYGFEPALALGREVAARVASPFFSVDVGLREDGVWRVVEVGDGQVSDLKEWSAEELFAIFGV